VNALRLVGRLLFVVPLALTVACSGADTSPAKWTLWYIPNEPKAGTDGHVKCHAYLFARAPKQDRFVVAIFKGWNGPHVPPADEADSRTGEEFTGTLKLGNTVIHDDSTGYDMNVDVVYVVSPYLTAKARADADCPPAAAPPIAPKPAAKKSPAPR
jgi:hypothetical protein